MERMTINAQTVLLSRIQTGVCGVERLAYDKACLQLLRVLIGLVSLTRGAACVGG